jgi:hypothetical protein
LGFRKFENEKKLVFGFCWRIGGGFRILGRGSRKGWE